MLTNKDIQRLTNAFEQVFVTKAEFYELRQDFRILQTAVDNFAKKIDNYHQEVIVLQHRVTRLEQRPQLQ